MFQAHFQWGGYAQPLQLLVSLMFVFFVFINGVIGFFMVQKYLMCLQGRRYQELVNFFVYSVVMPCKDLI